MRALIQRVKWAKVEVDHQTVGEIGPGILTFLGVAKGDTEVQAKYLMQKIINLRIFEDSQQKMNLNINDWIQANSATLHSQGGPSPGHLLISQFTLMADTSQGNRPSFFEAAPPAVAKSLYEFAISESQKSGVFTASGQFQADMKVHLVNDGPVTLLLEKSPSTDTL